MKIKIGDILIILFTLALAFILVFCDKNQGFSAVLEIDGQAVETFDLSVNEEYVYSGEFTNKIVIKDGFLSITESDCPDETCVHSGRISKVGQVICCLPNKAIVTIIGDKMDLDVISG